MQMLIQILTATPKWVFALFALLLWLGCKQLMARSVSLARATAIPVAMTALSVYGVLSAFSHQPVAVLGWAGALLVSAFVVLQRALPATTRYDATSRRFHVGGTAVPLVLMMGIFFTKYVVGVQVAMHPALVNDLGFALCIGTLYGAFSGIFAARSLRLWKLTRRDDRASTAALGA
jgi:hypothetical protein